MEKIPLPENVTVIREEGNEMTFDISPCYPGYGPTLANALRRTIISSVPGAAITTVRIEGVEHEFSAIPGVAEDVVSILLNLKRLRLKLHSDAPVELRLKAQGEKVVTAGDIEKVADAEIANPEHVIAHLTDSKATLDMVLTAERGRGYVPAEAREREERPLGTIAVDAIYTPVERVSFRVENVRVGQATEYHKILMTIRTDGTVTPKEVLAAAASILEDHFRTLAKDVTERLTYLRDLEIPEPAAPVSRSQELPRSGEAAPSLMPDTLERVVESPIAEAVRAPEERIRDPKLLPIVEFAVSTRIQNILEKEGVKTIAGLVQKTRSQLLGIPGLGEKALEEIEAALAKLGFTLKSEPGGLG